MTPCRLSIFFGKGMFAGEEWHGKETARSVVAHAALSCADGGHNVLVTHVVDVRNDEAFRNVAQNRFPV